MDNYVRSDSMASIRQRLQDEHRKTPTGLLALLALLVLVGHQTIQMNSSYLDLSSVTRGGAMLATNSTYASTVSSSNDLRKLPSGSHHRTTIPLSELTRNRIPPSQLQQEQSKCQGPWEWVENKETRLIHNWTQRVPLYIHQTSKTRCLHRHMIEVTEKWRNLPQYEYYFHDDDALWTLLNQPWPEFPHLHTVVRCLTSMTALTDVWRLLVLWEYGGIYVDLDSQPNSWTPSYIRPNEDSYFVVENYDAPSQYFMATTPRHPLMYYAIHQALSKIMKYENTQKIDASFTTGPFALLDGFTWFMLDVGKLYQKPVRAGLYQGRHNWTVRIDGFGRLRSDEIVKREAIYRNRKAKLYAEMNMSHFLDDLKAGRKTKLLGRSCFGIVYDLVIKPPEWYVPSAAEDRKTVGGIS